MSPRTRSPILHDVDVERRQQIAAEVVADAMITMPVRERLRELEVLDAERADADERARIQVRKAVRQGMRVGADASTSSVRARVGSAFTWR